MPVFERFYRAILDAMPNPVFLVDDDLHVYELNQAAANLGEMSPKTALQKRAGEILHCLHAMDSPHGCGYSAACSDCAFRRAVLASRAGQTVHRQRIRLPLASAGSTQDLELLVSVVPLPSEENKLAIMVLEDITELALLKRLLPICMYCKKVRDDHHYWQRLEEYLGRYSAVDFSHGVCPECMQQLDSEERLPDLSA